MKKEIVQSSIVLTTSYAIGVASSLSAASFAASQGSSIMYIYVVGWALLALATNLSVGSYEHYQEQKKIRLYSMVRMMTTGQGLSDKLLSVYMSLASDDMVPRHEEEATGRLSSLIRMLFSSVETLHDSLNQEFSTGDDRGSAADFEVTFMTKSIIDGGITIAAWANPNRVAPHSLKMRKGNKTFYDVTETAQLYRDPSNSMRLIENTDNVESYHECYAGQKERIKSTVVYPVVDHSGRLMGTIVLHTDQVGFFRLQDKKYWRKIIQPYAKCIASLMTDVDLVAKSNLVGPDDFF